MMVPTSRAALRRALLSAALLAVPAALDAQSLPAAADLMAKYTAAIGGEAAFAKIDNMHVTGTMSMPAQGISAQIDVWTARPNKMLVVSAIPGMGEVRQGFDGTTGWAVDFMQGARVLSGQELKQMTDESGIDSSMRLAKNFTSAETVEKTTLGGKECYKVKLVWKSGRTTHDCYDVADGLLVGSWMVQESPMGTMEASAVVSDYKEFGAVKMPTKTVTSVMGMEQILTFDKIEFTPIEAAKFELPAEIKALIKK